MKTDPKKILTIIVPTYNMEKYLDKCLTSLIVGDAESDLMLSLEVLVINDGSIDRSSEIAHGYESRYPHTFKVVDKENGNYGSCINAALPIATGKYVKILDADDWFDTDNLFDLIKFLSVTDVDLVLSDTANVNTDSTTISVSSYSDEVHPFQLLSFDQFMKNKLFDRILMNNVLYRLDNLKKIDYKQTEGISYTDTEWVFYPMTSVQTFAYFDKVLYCYLVGREGQTMQNNILVSRIDQLRKVGLNMCRLFASFAGSSLHLEYLRQRIIGYYFYVFSILFYAKKSQKELMSFIEELDKLKWKEADYEELFSKNLPNSHYKPFLRVKKGILYYWDEWHELGLYGTFNQLIYLSDNGLLRSNVAMIVINKAVGLFRRFRK